MLFLHLPDYKYCIYCLYVNPKCISSTPTCCPILFASTRSFIFIACSNNLIARYNPHPNGSHFFSNLAIMPAAMISFHKSMSHSISNSFSAFIISATTPDGPVLKLSQSSSFHLFQGSWNLMCRYPTHHSFPPFTCCILVPIILFIQ